MLCSLSHNDHHSERGPKGKKEGFTFSRKERIKRKKEFDTVYSEGKKRVGKYFVLYWRKNGLSHHRLGVVASKKVGNAVVRNRLKRIFRETFRQRKPSLQEGVDLVLVARRQMRDIPSGVFAEQYWNFLKAEGLTKGYETGKTT